MRKLLILLLCSFFAITQLAAQNRKITGKVTDANGNPVSKASILVKGTRIGTASATDGSFTITAPSSAITLIISSVDMVSQEVSIGDGTGIMVSLKADQNALQEVVVTGYSREKKTQFTGAASLISGKAVENVPVGAFDQALQGRDIS